MPSRPSCLLAFLLSLRPACAETVRDDGYRGVWYSNQPTRDEHAFKYSGGLGTYPQQHLPVAIHVPAARKTFFCYGGRSREKNELLHMVSYFDHDTGRVPRPTVLLNKRTDDAHENPVLQVDDLGHLWFFSPSHGTARPSYVHRSLRPWSVDGFERVRETNFSYPQPWHLPGRGFLFLHTLYGRGRGLFWSASPDGGAWDGPHPLAHIAQGDYQISARNGDRVATVFDHHPNPGGLNQRSNIYYLETPDQGRTWRTISGETPRLPLTDARNPALALDSLSRRELVYLKDLAFDAAGHPVILYLTAAGHEPGPRHGLRAWHTLRWTGREWERRDFTTSDHNYDHGSLYIEPDGTWRVIAPTDPGPQPWATGGEMVLWTSADQGATWNKLRALTSGSRHNHTYARRPLEAHPDFYALWADGDPQRPSDSRLYFCNRDGTRVARLPVRMDGEFAVPEILP